MGWGGGLLHLHVQTYPTSLNQQQATCYYYKDNNNKFTVLPCWDDPLYNPNNAMKFLKNSDVTRLSHVPMTCNLHLHTILVPVSKLNYEVLCYGNETIGDKHNHWRIEVVDDINQGTNINQIHSLTTHLRIKHEILGCYLCGSNTLLPQWGFKQVKVSCDKENNPKDMHTYWNVESHWNDWCMCFDNMLLIILRSSVFLQCLLAIASCTDHLSCTTSGTSMWWWWHPKTLLFLILIKKISLHPNLMTGLSCILVWGCVAGVTIKLNITY